MFSTIQSSEGSEKWTQIHENLDQYPRIRIEDGKRDRSIAREPEKRVKESYKWC